MGIELKLIVHGQQIGTMQIPRQYLAGDEFAYKGKRYRVISASYEGPSGIAQLALLGEIKVIKPGEPSIKQRAKNAGDPHDDF